MHRLLVRDSMVALCNAGNSVVVGSSFAVAPILSWFLHLVKAPRL